MPELQHESRFAGDTVHQAKYGAPKMRIVADISPALARHDIGIEEVQQAEDKSGYADGNKKQVNPSRRSK